MARTPLRFRLVAAVMALVVAALLGTGIAATATLRSYLVGRVDAQLYAVAANSGTTLISGGSAVADHGGRGDGDRLPSAYVTEVLGSDGQLLYGPTHNLLSGDEPLPALPSIDAQKSRASGTVVMTVGAVDGSATWRVLVEPVTLTDGSAGTLLVAQSLGDVDGTINHLDELLAGIGAAAVVVLGGISYLLVRASLKPLRAVENTAAALAGGDLGHRVPQPHPATEVGHLAGALNTMLADIESAFAARAASELDARAATHRAQNSELAARRSEERMRRFVADASHELRTPLTTIRGFAELCRQGAVADHHELERVMQRIESEAARMGVLVEDLLTLARLDAERPLGRELVDLLALATDAVHDARAVAPQRRIDLVLGATDPPPVVIGDEARLRQVLGNLTTNALRHTPPSSPLVIGVGTARKDATGPSEAVLTVADRGPGLGPEAARRVFERFYRVDTARSRDDGGSGLGLAIVAALVERHGGRVGVDTTPGGGATFMVVLPLAPETPETMVSPVLVRIQLDDRKS